MDTNKFFSFSRIALVMKREMMENGKTNMYRFIGLYAAFALVMAGYMWGMSGEEGAWPEPEFNFYRACHGCMSAFTFIILIAALAYASNIMENMTTKEKRIAFLMLPATMIEKFVARFLIVTLGLAVGAVVAMLLAEGTRYLLLPLFNLPDVFRQSFLYEFFKRIVSLGDHGWWGSLCGLAFFAWVHSLYVLGGNYWYKKPFFKVLGLSIFLSVLCSVFSTRILSVMDTETIHHWTEWLENHLHWMTLEGVLAIGIAFFSAFTLLNWWLSYKLFIRSQVVKPKFRWL